MPSLLRALWLVLLLPLGACLEFDAQEVVLRHDPAQDRIDVLLVYRGLHAEQSSLRQGTPLANALRDLEMAKASGRFQFWSNWPLGIDLVAAAGDKSPAAALLDHLDVENGGLFTDLRGQLCAWQFVRVREAKAFLHQLNTLLEVGVQQLLLSGITDAGKTHRFDADTRDLVREFLRSGQRFLHLDGGRLEFRLPCSDADFRWLKAELERQLTRTASEELLLAMVLEQHRRADGDPVEIERPDTPPGVPGQELPQRLQQAPTARFLWDNDWSLERQPELTTVALGVRSAPELRLRKASQGAYHPLLLDELRRRGEPIEDGVPDQELERRFAAFRARAAVLPPALATQRGKQLDLPLPEARRR